VHVTIVLLNALFSRFGYYFNKHLLTYLLTYLLTVVKLLTNDDDSQHAKFCAMSILLSVSAFLDKCFYSDSN